MGDVAAAHLCVCGGHRLSNVALLFQTHEHVVHCIALSISCHHRYQRGILKDKTTVHSLKYVLILTPYCYIFQCPVEEEELLVAGDFNDHYTVLRQIGKGAFGCVKMSYRNCDGLLVSTGDLHQILFHLKM